MFQKLPRLNIFIFLFKYFPSPFCLHFSKPTSRKSSHPSTEIKKFNIVRIIIKNFFFKGILKKLHNLFKVIKLKPKFFDHSQLFNQVNHIWVMVRILFFPKQFSGKVVLYSGLSQARCVECCSGRRLIIWLTDISGSWSSLCF